MSSPDPFADARGRIEAAALPYPIEWPNEPFKVPAPVPAPWLSVAMVGDLLEPVEAAQNGAWGEEGTLYVHVAVPKNSGSVLARQIGKQVAGLFRGVSGPIRYPRASIGAGQVAKGDGNYWVLTVTVDWTFTDR